MKVEMDTIGTKLTLVFEDPKRQTYGDCMEMTIRNEQGETIVRHAYVQKEELKRLAKSL